MAEHGGLAAAFPEAGRAERTGAAEAAVAAALGDAVGRARLVAGLVGRGIAASRTPGMHEAEGARLGLAYAYRLLDFDRMGLADGDLAGVVTACRDLGLAGLNVTHPFKEAVIPLLDGLSAEAAAIGAVNTVVFAAAGLATGHNTDAFGFAESFRRELAGVPLGEVVLIGAGGGGMAVAHALLGLGTASLHVVDAVPAKAAALAAKLAALHPGRAVAVATDAGAAVAAADGVVNATPRGMAKYPGSALPRGALRPGLWVADIIYFPAETELLAAARNAGCRTMGGAGMAIFQAVGAFRLFTGAEADPAMMAGHFARLAPAGADRGLT